MKKATDCGLAAIVLLMLFSLVLTAKDVFLATVPKDKNAALFLCLEIVLGIVIVCLPKIISVKFDLYLPPMIYGFFLLFIFGAIYLGTIYHFYRIPYWDKGLHLISGALLASFALALFGALVPKEQQELPPGFISLYATAFAMMCGVLRFRVCVWARASARAFRAAGPACVPRACAAVRRSGASRGRVPSEARPRARYALRYIVPDRSS